MVPKFVAYQTLNTEGMGHDQSQVVSRDKHNMLALLWTLLVILLCRHNSGIIGLKYKVINQVHRVVVQP